MENFNIGCVETEERLRHFALYQQNLGNKRAEN